MKKQQYSLITKKYAKNIWRKYIKAIEEYRLFSDGDRIYVPEDKTVAGRLTEILLQMTAEFKMYNIKIITEFENEEQPAVGDIVVKAQKHNCSKIALPQYFQDIMDNTLWEMLYNGRIHSMLPKEKQEDVMIIRPLYLIHREDIDAWADEAGIELQQQEKSGDKAAQLAYIRRIIKQLSDNNEAIENNVFGSVTNVDADMLMGYNLNDEHHEFLEWY